MKYNIIGDIHGRSNWEPLVREDAVNVFVGDYFSPYDRIPFGEQQRVFMEVIKVKEERPDTVLLIGNHDEDHWHIRERYSRHDSVNERHIAELFEEHKDKFEIAHAIEDKALVSHAGVSALWYETYASRGGRRPTDRVVNLSADFHSESIDEAIKYYMDNELTKIDKLVRYKLLSDKPIYLWCDGVYVHDGKRYVKRSYKPADVADRVNTMWRCGDMYSAFAFEGNALAYDCNGESVTQSPLWIRPSSLYKSNIFFGTEVRQFVGHTQMRRTAYDDNRTNALTFVDCLGQTAESLTYDTESGRMEPHHGDK